MNAINLNNIKIRNSLQSGDLGWIIYRHGIIYRDENNYGIPFEAYVASGLAEFSKSYDQKRDRIWICEYDGKIIGSMFLIHRNEDTAQLRYFYLEPDFRGFGLGSLLMELFMKCLAELNYKKAWLMTTNEQEAAANLYKKFGFCLAEEKRSGLFGKPLVEQRYEFKIT